MRALVLGSTGITGRKTAAELARSEHVNELVVAGRDEDRSRRLASLLGGPRRNVSSITFDARDGNALRRAMHGADVVVSCLGPSHAFEPGAVKASIEAGVSYASLCDSHVVTDEVLALAPAAADAGITAITGCGASPGLSGLLIGLAAEELDRVIDVDIAVAASSADGFGRSSAEGLLFSLTQDAPFLSDGRRSDARAGTLAKPVYFPGPVGWIETFRLGHPEVLSLSRRAPQLSALSFRFGLSERVLMDLSRGLAGSGLLDNEDRISLAERVLRPARPLLENVPPHGVPWTGIRCDVHGMVNERAKTVTLGVVDRRTNLASVPLALAAIELGTGRTKRPGVWSAVDALDVRSFLRSVIRRGVRVARLEPFPV